MYTFSTKTWTSVVGGKSKRKLPSFNRIRINCVKDVIRRTTSGSRTYHDGRKSVADNSQNRDGRVTTIPRRASLSQQSHVRTYVPPSLSPGPELLLSYVYGGLQYSLILHGNTETTEVMEGAI